MEGFLQLVRVSGAGRSFEILNPLYTPRRAGGAAEDGGSLLLKHGWREVV